MSNPRIRPIEAFPAKENLICLRDPSGFSDKMLLVPYNVLFVCSLLDGDHSLQQIRKAYGAQFGTDLEENEIRKIVEHLDQCFFLEGDRFDRERERIVREFKQAHVRPASHSGATYEDKPETLRAQLDDLFTQRGGPGLPYTKEPSGKMKALVAPHIDLKRGGLCYAWSYADLGKHSDADTFVILGICHNPTERRFVLTGKDFETPLGTVRTDADLVDRINALCDHDFSADEFVHRNEHSIEFQVLFLQYLFGEREKPFRIVPILCSSFYPLLDKFALEGEEAESIREEVDEFIGALTRALGERTDKMCLIAGVDLSHMGRRFGQDVSLSPEFVDNAKDQDRKMLQTVLSQEPERFLRFIQEERDRRNVCGVPAIYSLLKLLETEAGGEGRRGYASALLRYDVALEDLTQSLVSYAGVAFYDQRDGASL